LTLAVTTAPKDRSGILLALAATIAWGLLPSYFKILGDVPPLEILVHRILWSAVLIAVLLPALGQWPAFVAAITDRRTVAMLLLSSTLIAVNWLVYVTSVVGGHIVEASLGYYIMPLVNVVLGRLVLGERFTGRQVVACLIAAISVAVFALAAGSGIWRSLVLALTFGCYGLVRKLVRAEALPGLAAECFLLAPVAALWLIHCGLAGTLHLSLQMPRQSLLLLAAGLVTTLPLLSYAAAARRITLSSLGLIMYLNPTLQFVLGVAVYGEAFDGSRLIAFAGIWLALGLYTAETTRLARRAAVPRG
jgi:chloramphenicol-sensitive protein RarD